MANITTALLEFLMDLLRRPEAAAEFAADPETALANAGLEGITAADVEAVLPTVLDFMPIGRLYSTGGNSITSDDDTSTTGISAISSDDRGGDRAPAAGGEHGPAIEKVMSVVHNHSYIDDRDVVIDQSVNQSIWAHGDVMQNFDNDAHGNNGDIYAENGDVMLGDDNSYIGFDLGEGSEVEFNDSFNDKHSVDNSTNVDMDVDIDNSFNEDSTVMDIEDSLNNNDVDIKDSFNQYCEEDDAAQAEPEEVIGG